jgi:hypothetical protein
MSQGKVADVRAHIVNAKLVVLLHRDVIRGEAVGKRRCLCIEEK